MAIGTTRRARPGRPPARDQPAIRHRNDEMLKASEAGEKTGVLAERFRIAPKTVREGIAEARRRQEVRERQNLKADSPLTRRERQEISKAYGPNSKLGADPEVQEWMAAMRRLGVFDPAATKEVQDPTPEEPAAGRAIKQRTIPLDWNGWDHVEKREDTGQWKLIIPPRRKRLAH